MLLKNICVLDVACCDRDTSILSAARMMRKEHAGDLIVVDDVDEQRVPVGIITDRDIVIEVLAQGRDPASTSVGDVMTKQLAVAGDSEDVSEAIARMRTHGIRRIPIVNDAGGILGIVTLDDLFKLHADQAADLLAIITKEQTRESRAKR